MFTYTLTLILLSGVYCGESQWPQIVTVNVGSKVTLPCNQTSEAGKPEWRQLNGSSQRDVYRNHVIQPEFAGRFSVQRLPHGSCSLVIDNVQPVDSAVYKCMCGQKCEYEVKVHSNTETSLIDETEAANTFEKTTTENVVLILMTLFILAAAVSILVMCRKRFRRCSYCRKRWKYNQLSVGMSADFQRVLEENYNLLSRCLVVTDRLRFRLDSIEPIRLQFSKIDSTLTKGEKTQALLRILHDVHKSQQQLVWSDLLSFLRRNGQEHVANIFLPESDARPMSVDHYQKLNRNRKPLCQFLDLHSGLIEELVHRGVFNDSDKNHLTDYANHSKDVSQEVFDMLLCKPDSAFDEFVLALCATNQEHVASLLGYITDKIPMSKQHQQQLKNKRGQLVEFLIPTLSLMHALERDLVISEPEFSRVMSTTNYNQMSLEIINILCRKSDCAFEKFIKALNDTEQYHVVRILTGQGESPLSRVRRLVLRKARTFLVKSVDTKHTSLLANLISREVLTADDKQCIEAYNMNEVRVEWLIDIIARKSQKAYDRFLVALVDSGHKKHVDLLRGLELDALVDPHFLEFPDNPQRLIDSNHNIDFDRLSL